MAQITWNGAAGDDDFFTGGNWIGGVAPGPGDDAVIPAGFVVNAASGTVNTLSVAATTTLTVENSEGFTINGASTGADPTGTSVNSGTIVVNDNATLTLDGTLAGTGTLALASGGGDDTNLVLGATGATLAGGGTIVLGDVSGNNRIYGAGGSDVLTNAGDTIEGSGQLGAGQLTFVNASLVDATGTSHALVLNAVTTNTGTIEATGPAGLVIQSTVTNVGGLIAAVGASTVTLENGADIIGGTITTTGAGLVQLLNSNIGILDGSTGPLTNAGTVQVDDNATLEIVGTIHNTGTIALASGGGDLTSLEAVGTTTTLDGGGTIVMGDISGNNRIFAAAGTDVLVNVDNTIEGSGQLGDGQLTLINQAVIDATGAANALVLNANLTTNPGLIEATGTAGLLIESTVDNAGGLIEAVGTSTVTLQAGDDVVGGTITTTGAGLVELINSNIGTLDGSAGPLTNAGVLQVDDNATLEIVGTIHNTGTIALASGGGDLTSLEAVGTTTTLDGGGTIVMGDISGNNRIFAAAGTDVLVNVDNTIEGSGQLGDGQLTLANDALVDATGAIALVLNANLTTNTGTIEATGTAGLVIESTVLNTGGLIKAVGTSTVTLQAGDDIVGGTITGPGLVELLNSNVGTLDGSAGPLTNSGIFQIDDNATLELYGTINNTGTIALASGGGDLTNLVAASPTVTLGGGGAIILGNVSLNNRIYGAGGSTVLVNTDNTIEGVGQVGAGQLTLVNTGTIIDNNGYLDLNATLTQAGSLVIAGHGSQLEINQADTSGSVTFTGQTETLTLDQPNSFGATIAGFGTGDVIALAGDDATGAALDGTTLAITLSNGTVLDYTLADAIPGATAFVVPYGGGTDVEVTGGAPCYAAGTRILTTRGEVPVEDLVVGDHVVTMFGAGSRPIVWLGHRRVRGDTRDDRNLTDPIRVCAGAFGDAPTRDLLLSPDHAVLTCGALVPIHLLVDGQTIRRERHEVIVYHHVELDQHDVILAEGLPAESYLDTGNRSRFANAALAELRPAFTSGQQAAELCAPLVLEGARLDRIRSARTASRMADGVVACA